MKVLIKEDVEKLERIAKRMESLQLGDYESQRTKLLKELIESKVEEYKIKAQQELKTLIGGQ